MFMNSIQRWWSMLCYFACAIYIGYGTKWYLGLIGLVCIYTLSIVTGLLMMRLLPVLPQFLITAWSLIKPLLVASIVAYLLL